MAILNPILDGLREVHEKGFIHRDIKPQNIYLTRQGRPILLDFGTARLAMAERSRSMSVVLSAGYAPFEQYSRRSGQGPWTDVYACAAVLYFMLTGQTPAEAMDRVEDDTLILPQRLVPDLSERLAKVVVQGLATEAKQRYQTIRAFQEALLHAADTEANPKAQTGRIPLANLGHNKAAARKPLLGIVLLALIGIGFVYLLPAAKPLVSLPVADSIEMADRKFFAHQYNEALPIYQRLAEKNNGLAQFRLGSLYENGFGGVAMDAHQAAAWYERSANAGNPFGQYSVGRLYHNGWDKPIDENQAQHWFDKAMANGLKAAAEPLAKANDPIMSFIAARIAGDEKRYSQAFAWYQSAAEQGYATAQFNFAMMYKEGQSAVKNEAEVLKWCTASAEQGLALAQNCLGEIYAQGAGVKQNDTEATRWYHRAAEQGHAVAQFNLGWMYDAGKGVDKSATEAVYWYRLAAQQGYANGQFALGVMYKAGTGVNQSDTEAAHWYRLAAEQGHASAQNNLGSIYSAAHDYPEAIKWFKKAAEQGEMIAQYNLGNQYSSGTDQNLAEAKYWYQKAAQQGYAAAIEALKRLKH